MKKGITIAGFFLSAVLLAGCAGTDVQETTEPAIVTISESTTINVTETETTRQETVTEAHAESFEWKIDAPSAHGLDDDIFTDLHEKLKGTETYSMLVVKDGVIIDEFYNEGYNADSKFPFHSGSKSVTGTLIGIAMEQGYIGSENEPLSDYVSEALQQADARKADITIRDLLTNTSGLDWDEWNSYDVWTEFRAAGNWVDYILGRDLVYDPGEHFTYSTGNTHLLSAALEKAVGKNQFEYAMEVLFEPLGMESVEWGTDPRGITDGGNGIIMTARDAVRFGQMCLQNGEWEGRRIVPAEWLEESTTPKTEGYGDLNGDYGYQWWMREYHGIDTYYAYGYAGQYIFIVPDQNMVCVMTGNYPATSYKAREYFTEDVMSRL